MAAGDVTATVTSNTSKKCAVFDGSNDYVQVAADSSAAGLDEMATLTVSAWVRRENTSGTEVIFCSHSAGTLNWHLESLNTGVVKFSVRNASNSTVSTTGGGSMTAGTWHHVMGVYDGATVTVYLDTVASNSIAQTGNVDKNGFPCWIGARSSGGAADPLKGNITGVKVWKTALTSTERTSEYQGTPVTRLQFGEWNFQDGTYDDSVGSNNATNSGTYIAIMDGAIATAIKAQRVTANDNWIAAGLVGGQIVCVGIEEA